jgi:hypothetical protein
VHATSLVQDAQGYHIDASRPYGPFAVEIDGLHPPIELERVGPGQPAVIGFGPEATVDRMVAVIGALKEVNFSNYWNPRRPVFTRIVVSPGRAALEGASRPL